MRMQAKHGDLGNAACSSQYFVWSPPSIEAGINGQQHSGRRGEVAVVCCEASGQRPDLGNSANRFFILSDALRDCAQSDIVS